MLFLAMAAYLGVYIWRSAQARLVTAPLAAAELRQSVDVTGLVVRQELALTAEAPVLVLAPAGERLPAGGLVAAVSSDAAALAREAERAALRAEAARLEAVLDELAGAGASPAAGGAREAALALAAAVARGEAAGMDGAAAALEAALFPAGGAETLARLEALRARLDGLGASGAAFLTAPEAGLFLPGCDGLEGLTPGDLAALGPAGLDELLAAEAAPPEGAFGRLVTGSRWYFAAALPAEAAMALAQGDELRLDLGGGTVLAARLAAWGGSAADGRRVALLSGLTGLDALAGVRRAGASLVWGELSGLRAPAGALCTDADGARYVWAVVDGCAARREVTVLLDEGDSVLLAPAEGQALAAGTPVLAEWGGREIYEGMAVLG